jgi:methionyl-tRNA formyltransferase
VVGEPLNLVFAGTPAFAVPSLDSLVRAGFGIKLVVTQPDRPKGRGMELAYSPVKQRAVELGLPLTQPEKIKNNPEFRSQLESIRPQAIIVVGYGRLIPQWMLELPPLGNINVHASLLPKYRGAAPIQWAIANGETETGVTTMKIDAGLDTGDILQQRRMQIEDDDTSETLAPRLAALGAELLVETLDGLHKGEISPRWQASWQATLAPLLKKEDGAIDFNRTAQEIGNRMRGFQPWPGAFTTFRGKLLHIWTASTDMKHMPPAEILVAHDRMLIGCAGESALVPEQVQPEGKKRMSVRDFVHGYHPRSGEVLGS